MSSCVNSAASISRPASWGWLRCAAPSFVPPSAIAAAIFYLVAGVEHVKTRERGRSETIAMISDLFIAAVLAVFAVGIVVRGPP